MFTQARQPKTKLFPKTTRLLYRIKPLSKRYPTANRQRPGHASPETKWMQWHAKRLLDIGLSLAGIIALSPVFLLISLAIKLDSSGPVLIKQRRLGYLGKPFYMYKFRSMVPDAHKRLDQLRENNETNDLMFKMKRDPRVTRVGYWLRRYSLDEFPQLLNVIKGEMSLVGPRPPLPEEVHRYKKSYLKRFGTLPGLTGYWQVSGRADIQLFDEVVHLDTTYIREWSLWLDCLILLKTLPVVVYAKGAA